MALWVCLLHGCMETKEERFINILNQGNKEYKNAEYKKSIEVWKEALEIDFNNALVFRKIAKSYKKMANYELAEKSFNAAIDTDPDDIEAQVEIAKLRILLSDFNRAHEICNRLIGSNHTNAEIISLNADLLMIKSEYIESEIAYREAIQRSPDMDEFKVKLSICLLAQNKKEDALDIVSELKLSNATSPHLLLSLALFYRLIDDIEQADKYIEMLLSRSEMDYSLQLSAADHFVSTGRLDRAESILQKMLKSDLASISVKKSLAHIWLLQRKPVRVKELIDINAGINTKDNELLLLIARTHLMMGNTSLAISYLEKVIENEGGLLIAHYLLGVAYFVGGYDQLGSRRMSHVLALEPDFSPALLAMSAFFYKSEEYPLSLESADKVMELEPENDQAYIIAGNAYLMLENYHDARAQFNIAATLNPDNIAPTYYLALTDELDGQYAEAKAAYQSILRQFPDYYNVADRLSRLMIKHFEYGDALAFFESIENDHPNAFHLSTIVSELYYLIGDYTEAKNHVEAAIEANPEAIENYLLLAAIYDTEGDRDKIASVLEESSKLCQSCTDPIWMLSSLYAGEDRIEKAIDVLHSSSPTILDDPVQQNNLASLYLQSGRNINKALTLSQKAYEKLPKDPAIADTLGWAYYKKKVYHQSVWYLSEAEELLLKTSELKNKMDRRITPELSMDTLPIVKFHLGMALTKSGKTKAGKVKLREALDLGLNGPDANQAQSILAEAKDKKESAISSHPTSGRKRSQGTASVLFPGTRRLPNTF